MNSPAVPRRLGPIWLAPGFTRGNALTYLYAAFFSVCLLAFLSFIQPYTLNVNLGIPKAEQGSVTGLLGFCNEIVSLLLIGPFGALSDKIGRRRVYVLGFVWIGAGFAVIPLAHTLSQLVIATMFWAVGAAAIGAMLSTVLADTPDERSRGALVGLTGVFQALGVLLVVVFLSYLPHIYGRHGLDPLWAGRLTYWTATALCLISALVCFIGLNHGTPGGTPGQQVPHASLRSLLREGAAAAVGNRRILLAYSVNFMARADMVLIGTFFSLRVTQAGVARGMDPAQALLTAGRIFGLAQGAALLWAIVFLFVADRFDRVTVVIVAMALAAAGYIWIGMMADPLSPAIWLAAVVMGFGEVSVILAGQALLGQQAPAAIRGSVVGLAGILGSLGIVFANVFGGWLYDTHTAGAPFVVIGACNLVILLFALSVRLRRGE